MVKAAEETSVDFISNAQKGITCGTIHRDRVMADAR